MSDLSRRGFLQFSLGILGTAVVPKGWLPLTLRQQVNKGAERLSLQVGLGTYGLEEVSGGNYARQGVELSKGDEGWASENVVEFPSWSGAAMTITHALIFTEEGESIMALPIMSPGGVIHRDIHDGDTASFPVGEIALELLPDDPIRF